VGCAVSGFFFHHARRILFRKDEKEWGLEFSTHQRGLSRTTPEKMGVAQKVPVCKGLRAQTGMEPISGQKNDQMVVFCKNNGWKAA
jgi:hypothetical protein